MAEQKRLFGIAPAQCLTATLQQNDNVYLRSLSSRARSAVWRQSHFTLAFSLQNVA